MVYECVCDLDRHMVCRPYSVAGLHAMAKELGIDRAWFHNNDRFPHYDMPKGRRVELEQVCTVVTSRELVNIIKTGIVHA
jgi:hypothetical protein